MDVIINYFNSVSKWKRWLLFFPLAVISGLAAYYFMLIWNSFADIKAIGASNLLLWTAYIFSGFAFSAALTIVIPNVRAAYYIILILVVVNIILAILGIILAVFYEGTEPFLDVLLTSFYTLCQAFGLWWGYLTVYKELSILNQE